MNPVARAALVKLLGQAESSWGRRDASERSVALRFSEASFPAYVRVDSHAERLACNAELQLAEQRGAITVEWDPRAGDKRQIERIQVRDRDSLVL